MALKLPLRRPACDVGRRSFMDSFKVEQRPPSSSTVDFRSDGVQQVLVCRLLTSQPPPHISIPVAIEHLPETGSSGRPNLVGFASVALMFEELRLKRDIVPQIRAAGPASKTNCDSPRYLADSRYI